MDPSIDKSNPDPIIIQSPYNPGFQPPYNPGFQSPYLTRPVDKFDLLKQFFRKYDISQIFQEDVDSILQYDIIIIADDSTSMTTPSTYLSFKTNKEVTNTRWDELRETIEVIIEFAICLDNVRIDVHFLNIETPLENITSIEQLNPYFNRVPRGSTPLTKVLKRVIDKPSTKPKLILIATDGEPNDENQNNDCYNFINLLKMRDSEKNRIGILVCTTQNLEYLNEIDKEAKHVDIIDDYISEYNQIISIQGKDFSYTHGDHILKMLLGPILHKYDDLDEIPIKSKKIAQKKRNTHDDCCSIM
jgi:hypothetical protein